MALKPETTKTGRSVGQPHGDVKKAREIKLQLKGVKGKKGALKGHRRSLVRPVHQGASFSGKFLEPKMRGAEDQSRRSVFGDL